MDRPEEFIEAYLANKLTPNQKQEFESSVADTPWLKNELKLQSSIINSIKNARTKELKTILNQVKTQPASSLSTTSKIGIFTGVIGLISLLYFVSVNEKPQTTNTVSIDSVGSIAKKTEPTVDPLPAKKIEEPISQNSVASKHKAEATKKTTITPLNSNGDLRKPLDVIDPTLEVEAPQNEPPSSIVPEKNVVAISNISVENDTSDSRYIFHYKFHKGKLILYGAFDNSLYEILEINGKKRVIFLYYKEQYYLLDENQRKVRMLEPIKDPSLLEKLTEYRLNKK